MWQNWRETGLIYRDIMKRHKVEFGECVSFPTVYNLLNPDFRKRQIEETNIKMEGSKKRRKHKRPEKVNEYIKKRIEELSKNEIFWGSWEDIDGQIGEELFYVVSKKYSSKRVAAFRRKLGFKAYTVPKLNETIINEMLDRYKTLVKGGIGYIEAGKIILEEYKKYGVYPGTIQNLRFERGIKAKKHVRVDKETKKTMIEEGKELVETGIRFGEVDKIIAEKYGIGAGTFTHLRCEGGIRRWERKKAEPEYDLDEISSWLYEVYEEKIEKWRKQIDDRRIGIDKYLMEEEDLSYLKKDDISLSERDVYEYLSKCISGLSLDTVREIMRSLIDECPGEIIWTGIEKRRNKIKPIYVGTYK